MKGKIHTVIIGSTLPRTTIITFTALLLLFVFPLSSGAQDVRWAKTKRANAGPAKVIGGYTNGCISGAKKLSSSAKDYRLLRAHTNRHWGHPALIAFVERLARFSRSNFNRPLLIADLGQPRGGPITGHASHEVGLDGDIRFLLLPDKQITSALLTRPAYVSMLNRNRSAINRSRWSGRQVRMLRFTAQDRQVDRIFVHPIIKKELCRIAGKDRGWLGKVVAWYGHYGHMHVRMRCPAGSPQCKPQSPIPRNDGCGKTLTWWLKQALPAAKKWLKLPRRPAGRTVSALPKACAAVLKAR